MVTGFFVDRSQPGVEDNIQQIRGVDGTQYSEGDACLISTTEGTAGLVIQAPAQTSAPQFVFLAMVSDKSYLRPPVFDEPTAAFEFLELINVAGTPIVLSTQFPAATFDGTACASNASTTTVVFSDGGVGATDDFTGGQVYINELNEQRTVVNDQYSSPNHTLTVAPAFSQAPTTGNTLRVVPWGPGYVGGVKLESAQPQQGISVAVADKTGGHVYIFDVDLALRTAYVRLSGVAVNP